MFNAYKVGVTLSLLDHVTPTLSKIITGLARTDAEAQKLQKRLDGIKAGFVGGFAAIGAGLALAAPFKAGIHEAAEFEKSLMRLKMIGGIDADTIKTVRSDALSGKLAGIAPTQQVDMFRDLHAAFGDKHHAQEFMPQFAAIARISETMYGKNIAGSEEDLKALARVAERRGGTKSVEAMDKNMDIVTKILIASGGAVSAKDIQKFGARMGASFNTLSDDGLLKEWALMQEMGGSQAGTSFASALQNLAYGRASEAAGMNMRKYGLVDEAKNEALLKEHYGGKWQQHINKVEAGAIKGFDQLITDKMGWVQDVMLPSLKAKGVTSDKDVSLAAALMMSNRRGADDIAMSATQIGRILKDYGIAKETKGYKEVDAELQKNPAFKLAQLHKDWDRAMVNLGESALPVAIPLVNKLSSALRQFSEYADKNPETIKHISSAFLGLSALLVGGGVISILASTAKSFRLLGDVLMLATPSTYKMGLAAGRFFAKISGALRTAWPFMAAFGQGVFMGIVGPIKALAQVILIAGRALFLNPIGLAITAIGVAAYLLWKNWDSIKPKLLELWESIKTGFHNFIHMYLSGWQSLFNFLIEGINKLLPKAMELNRLTFADDYAKANLPQKSGSPYIKPGTERPMQVTVVSQLDGREVARSTTMYQAREANRPGMGAPTFDPTMGARPVGLGYAR